MEEEKSRPLTSKGFVHIKEAKDGEGITEDDLKLINQYTRKELTAGEVYMYPVILCDNEVDRDAEYFTFEDLQKIAPMYVAKTGILNHSWSATAQHSRIIKTEVLAGTNPVTGKNFNMFGEPYYYVKAWAYTIKQGNEDFIAKIDGGILKEVSTGFSVADKICKVCGNSYYDYENCKHIRGRTYKVEGEDRVCYLRMKDPTDAYEFSFVAVPAQPAAGATKSKQTEPEQKEAKKVESLRKLLEKAKENGDENISISTIAIEKELKDYDAVKLAKEAVEAKVAELEPLADMGKQYKTDLVESLLRKGATLNKNFPTETMKSLYNKASIDELKAFEQMFDSQLEEQMPPSGQIKGSEKGNSEQKAATADISSYKLR